jgi:hypothetical protein
MAINLHFLSRVTRNVHQDRTTYAAADFNSKYNDTYNAHTSASDTDAVQTEYVTNCRRRF